MWGVKPSKVSLVEIPEGTTLMKSYAGPQTWKREVDNLSDLIQEGGGVQYEVLDFDSSWFKEIEGVTFSDIIAD